MAKKFNCEHCDREIISKFLKIGEGAKCKFCGTSTLIPGNAEDVDDSEYDKYTEKLKWAKNTHSDNIESFREINKTDQKSKVRTFSQKYDLLKSFRIICYILMLLDTIIVLAGVIKLIESMDNINKVGGDIDFLLRILFVTTVNWLVAIVTLFCITILIGSLFDLNEKINKK